MSNKIRFNLLVLMESIDKIKLYSKDFRNIIAHDYFGIDADEIWDIIQSKILPLKNDIENLHIL